MRRKAVVVTCSTNAARTPQSLLVPLSVCVSGSVHVCVWQGPWHRSGLRRLSDSRDSTVRASAAPVGNIQLATAGEKTAAGEEEDEIVEGKKVRDQFFGSGGITAEGERRGQPLHKAVWSRDGRVGPTQVRRSSGRGRRADRQAAGRSRWDVVMFSASVTSPPLTPRVTYMSGFIFLSSPLLLFRPLFYLLTSMSSVLPLPPLVSMIFKCSRLLLWWLLPFADQRFSLITWIKCNNTQLISAP